MVTDIVEEVRRWRNKAILNSDKRLMKRLCRMEVDKEPKGMLWAALILIVVGAVILVTLNVQYLRHADAPRINIANSYNSTNVTNSAVTNLNQSITQYVLPEGENLVCVRVPGAQEMNCKWEGLE